MSENAPGGNAKTMAQDLFGILACMLGGFSAVSVFLAMRGQESKYLLARPVEGAMVLFGSPAALVIAVALAALGMAMFLGRRPIAPVRHLVGLFAVGLGLALVVGGVRPRLGGLLGSALPDALPGIPGQAAGFAIGVIVLVAAIWVVWLARLGSAGVGTPGAKPSSLVGILRSGTADQPSDGVSVAEARALQGLKAPSGNPARPSAQEGSSGPFSHVSPAKPIAKPTAHTAKGTDGPSRPQSPATPVASQPLAEPSRARAPAPVRDAAVPHVAAKRDPAPGARPLERPASLASAAALEAAALPLPSWETQDDDEDELDLDEGELEASDLEEDDGGLPQVGAARTEEAAEEDFVEESAMLFAAALEDEDDGETDVLSAASFSAPEPVVEDDEEPEPPAIAALEDERFEDEDEAEEKAEVELDEPAPVSLAAARAELGIEDEDETELEEELEPIAEPVVLREEPEPALAEAPALDDARWEQVGLFDEPAAPAHEPEVAAAGEPAALAAEPLETEPAYVLQPEQRARPAVVLEGGESELDTLTYEAGCLVLEQNRVAVSMLQKRFQLDFDQACEILDRLQSVGLIGPYVGGRSREILLSREEWESVAHA